MIRSSCLSLPLHCRGPTFSKQRLFKTFRTPNVWSYPIGKCPFSTNSTLYRQGPNDYRSRVEHNPTLVTSPEVRDALMTNRPVVALETTIYTHGFPYPDNVALANDLEAIVRQNGAVPATIGIVDGIARIGMTKEELEMLNSTFGNSDTMKVSRRDLPYILGLVNISRD
jgi:hypothetical protein